MSRLLRFARIYLARFAGLLPDREASGLECGTSSHSDPQDGSRRLIIDLGTRWSQVQILAPPGDVVALSVATLMPLHQSKLSCCSVCDPAGVDLSNLPGLGNTRDRTAEAA